MDDNKTNKQENQPMPIYETVPEEDARVGSAGIEYPAQAPAVMQPEEIPSNVSTAQEAYSSEAGGMPPSDEPPPIYDDSTNSKTKYLFIGGGVIFFLFIFILILSLFRGGRSTKKDITLTYWTLWESPEVFAPLIKDYETKNPHIKIQVQQMTPEDYREKLSARIPQGKGPDIFRFHNTWLPELKDIIAPLPSTILSNAEFEKTFYPVQSKDLKIGNSYYGIPLEIDGLVLIYNDGLFKKANIDKPPASLDELVKEDFLSKLTFKNSNNKLVSSAIAMGTTANVEHFSDIFGLLLLQNGGQLNKLQDPAATGALEGYRKFAEAGIWDDTMPNSVAAFVQEKVAMIIAPSYEILAIKAQNKDIQLKVAPIPFNLPGNQSISLANYWAEGVSVKSPNSTEAWKFVKFLSEKENMKKLYAEQSKTRIFGEPYSRVDLANLITSNEYIGIVVQQGGRYYSMPLISKTFDKGLNDNIVEYLKNAVNASAQGQSYSEALTTASKGVNDIYTQYKIQ